MSEKIETKAELKCFNGKFKIEKDFTSEGSEYQYTRLVSHEGTEYVLRGFCIPLQTTDSTSQEWPEDCLEQMSRVYEKYFLMKAVSCFNLYIAKPLCLDYAIDELGKRVHIEIIFECDGTAWSEWRPMSVEQVYGSMEQSVSAFLLLRNLGAVDPDIKPSDVMYDYSKDELKFVSAGKCPKKVAIIEQRAPERLDEAKKQCADAYDWAVFFCSLISRKEESILKSGKNLTKTVKRCLDSVKTTISREKEMKKTMTELLISAINSKQKGLTLEEVIANMKQFKETKQRKLKEIAELLLLEERQGNFLLEEVKLNNMVELKCKHKVAKINLVRHVLEAFLKKKPYKYSYPCKICNKERGLARLPLDCGCSWTEFGKKIKFDRKRNYGTCDKNDSLSVADLGLVNDYISFNHALAMLLHHSKEESESALSDFFDIILKPRGGRYISSRYGDQVATLNIEGMKLSIDAAKVANMVLKSGKPVIALNLFCSKTNYKHAKILCAGLKTNRTLKALYLNLFKLADMGMKSISQVLKTNKTLEFLELGRIGTIEIGRAIFEALRTNRVLKTLRLSSNHTGSEGAKIMGEVLKDNKTLTHLMTSFVDIGVEGAKALGKGLKVNKMLLELALGYGQIELEGAKAISEAIKTNKTLKKLHLNDIKLGDEGVKAISEGLKVNRSLTHIDFRYTEMGDESAKAISEAIKVNRTLKELDVSKNNVKDEGTMAIAKALELNPICMEVIFDRDDVSDEVYELIEEMRNTNPRVGISYN